MKFYLICTIAFLLPVTVYAQRPSSVQPVGTVSYCPNFPMLVIKPLAKENELAVIKPNSKVDFKLVIVNPCVSKDEPSPTSLFPVNPLLNNQNNLQLPIAPFDLDKNNFMLTTKQLIPLNPILTIK